VLGLRRGAHRRRALGRRNWLRWALGLRRWAHGRRALGRLNRLRGMLGRGSRRGLLWSITWMVVRLRIGLVTLRRGVLWCVCAAGLRRGVGAHRLWSALLRGLLHRGTLLLLWSGLIGHRNVRGGADVSIGGEWPSHDGNCRASVID
jgi:hypothetical protein